ncbi:MAG: PKD-like domain-containing protein [Niabella sp.]
MKKSSTYLLLAILMVVFYSCKKEDITPPSVTLSVAEETITAFAQTTVKIEATIIAGNNVVHVWKVDDHIVSTTNVFEYTFEAAGSYHIYYTASNQAGEVKKQYTVNIGAPVREGGTSEYVTALFEFVPAPGQFINKAPGNQESAEGLLGKKGMVSLGAWGGYVVYGFDHSVPDKEGNDIEVMGNALTEWSEPGIIYVMSDDNGNGKPDDTWYELAGSEFGNAATYLRNYEVTYFRPESADKDVAWEDNKGNTGFVKKNNFHRQAYYPEWITADSYTLKGSWLQTKVDPSRPTYVVSLPYDWGYADNTIEATGGGKVDISNAVDAQGNKVNLKAIDFIKVQTGVLADGGWLGEVSTEVTGIKDLHFSANK